MTNKPSMSIIRGLLFTYDIENTDDFEREKLIASKDINNEKELTELFDELTKPEFLDYSRAEQEWFITSITHYLAINDDFDEVFKNMATYFSAPVTDQRKFIQILLTCLERYYNTTKSKS
ncbi:hypothetical protein SOP86_27390 [Pseudomonas canadensis]|uniref:hypothetical protein n=1 Tax=Pseudomonas canadensis TaxID=915099 RepID=UPI000F06B63E|nr:hypothetical protein [Pseudomonas canadensis]MEB2649366.1 hypothetical protein [Pseudomonas canadensis]